MFRPDSCSDLQVSASVILTQCIARRYFGRPTAARLHTREIGNLKRDTAQFGKRTYVLGMYCGFVYDRIFDTCGTTHRIFLPSFHSHIYGNTGRTWTVPFLISEKVSRPPDRVQPDGWINRWPNKVYQSTASANIACYSWQQASRLLRYAIYY